MWKPSKKILLVLMIFTAVMGGITLNWVDWKVFDTGKGVFRELQLPIIFLALSLYFMVPYVKKLKEEKKDMD